jgi:hypothetical protein
MESMVLSCLYIIFFFIRVGDIDTFMASLEQFMNRFFFFFFFFFIIIIKLCIYCDSKLRLKSLKKVLLIL